MPVSKQFKMIRKEMRSRRVHGDPKVHSALQLLLSEEERNLSLPVEEMKVFMIGRGGKSFYDRQKGEE